MIKRPTNRRPPRVIPRHTPDSPRLTSASTPDTSESESISTPNSRSARRRLAIDRMWKQRQWGGIKRASHEDIPSVVPRNAPFRLYISTRLFSGITAGLMLLLFILFMSNSAFFVHEIYVGGTRYLSPPEIFQRSGLANMHVFWIDPNQVERILKADPAIASAQVDVGWPPSLVQISITEREPALIWQQSGQRVWVDVRGRVMQLRQDLPDLVRVVVENPAKTVRPGLCPLQGMDELLGPGSCIAPETVAGALQFKALYPQIKEIVYDPNPTKGLGYHDSNGWVLWFGDGKDIKVKMDVYNRIVEEMFAKNGVRFVEINVTNPDRPVYKIAPR